jgi:hypothetical protein
VGTTDSERTEEYGRKKGDKTERDKIEFRQ